MATGLASSKEEGEKIATLEHEKKTLKAEIEASLRAKECPICFEPTNEGYVLNPCGHELCHECKDLVSVCPLVRLQSMGASGIM